MARGDRRHPATGGHPGGVDAAAVDVVVALHVVDHRANKTNILARAGHSRRRTLPRRPDGARVHDDGVLPPRRTHATASSCGNSPWSPGMPSTPPSLASGGPGCSWQAPTRGSCGPRRRSPRCGPGQSGLLPAVPTLAPLALSVQEAGRAAAKSRAAETHWPCGQICSIPHSRCAPRH